MKLTKTLALSAFDIAATLPPKDAGTIIRLLICSFDEPIDIPFLFGMPDEIKDFGTSIRWLNARSEIESSGELADDAEGGVA